MKQKRRPVQHSSQKTTKVLSDSMPSPSLYASLTSKKVKRKAKDPHNRSATSIPRSETLYPLLLMINPSASGSWTRTDAPYRAWSTKLIRQPDCDSQTFAMYEFFYSDLDRPWFTYDWFGADIASRGVSPGSNFSRSDWLLIRREILSRPRRFSKRFIKQELRKLEEYRSTARCLQHTGLPRPEGFPFEVVHPIKYGAHVTAFNDQRGALSRGIVVDYNMRLCAYCVSFDGLPSTLCPDTAVASHKPTQTLLHPLPIVVNDIAIESSNIQPNQDMVIADGKSKGSDHDVVMSERNGFASDFLSGSA